MKFCVLLFQGYLGCVEAANFSFMSSAFISFTFSKFSSPKPLNVSVASVFDTNDKSRFLIVRVLLPLSSHNFLLSVSKMK